MLLGEILCETLCEFFGYTSMKHIDLEEYNKLTEQIIGAAIEVHRHLGPGLLESAYETCLAYELDRLELKFER